MSDKRAEKALNDPDLVLARGIALIESGDGALAARLAAKARAANPEDGAIEAVARLLESHRIARFHSNMLHDTARNAAYRQAIERFAPGRRVLDIGTGSGLLAMMAARAGAESVVACEKDPRLAETARQIIAANGLADRITVIDKFSYDLDRDRDLDGGVDCVVSEIFSDDLVGENVLPALAHARSELCTPDAIFIPEKASIRIALGEHPKFARSLPEVEGFDLSAFEKHFQTFFHTHTQGKLEMRGEAQTPFEITFAADKEPPASDRESNDLVSSGGAVNMIVQWVRLDFAPGIAYENHPGSGLDKSWLLRVTPLEPRETQPGDIVRVDSWYSTDRLFHWENRD